MNSWVAFDNGLPNVIVNELEIYYSANKIRAATYGRGLWESDLYDVSTPLIISVIDSLAPLCYDSCDGFIQLEVTGGSIPYIYIWNNSATTDSIFNLCAGEYIVTVTDASLQTATYTVSLSEPAELVVNLNNLVHPSSAGECDGSITISVSGGNPYYTYLWSNGQLIANPAGLCAGLHTVSITDANGCTKTESYTLIDPNPDTISITVSDTVNPTCYGSCDGYIVITATGGTPPYIYLWSNASTDSIAVALCAGEYYVTVTDINLLTAVDTINLSEPDSISLVIIASTDITCYQCCDGTAIVIATGGTGGFLYNWSNNRTGPAQDSLCQGSYYVTITDFNGCTLIDSVFIASPFVFTATMFDIIQQTCHNQCNGSSTVMTIYGYEPFSYLWSNGDTNATADSLCAGYYTVTVTDADNDTASASVSIINPVEIELIMLDQIAASCDTCCDGWVVISAENGTPPYSFLWESTSTEDTLSNLCSGDYIVTITDANLCTATGIITIANPDTVLIYPYILNEPLCFGDCNGAASVNIYGGIPPYSYLWSNGGTDSIAQGLCAGIYEVTVTDSNSHSATDTVTITNPDTIQIIVISQTPISCQGCCDATIVIEAYGGTGAYSFLWSNSETNDTASALCPAIYEVTATDNNGCTASIGVEVENPFILTAIITDFLNAGCVGDCNGSATVTVTGGTPPYLILWSNNDTLATIA
ncbi:MAG: SprB repeat-containing protein, partial [Bacteroidia bacterium]|nr:SprB repeat-containing protein [Bacteroidia bacterium]